MTAADTNIDTTITLVETGKGNQTAAFVGGVFFGFYSTPWGAIESIIWYFKNQRIAPEFWAR